LQVACKTATSLLNKALVLQSHPGLVLQSERAAAEHLAGTCTRPALLDATPPPPPMKLHIDYAPRRCATRSVTLSLWRYVGARPSVQGT